jgi:hypothetical protein
MDVHHTVIQACVIAGFPSSREENRSLALKDEPDKFFRNLGKKLTIIVT